MADTPNEGSFSEVLRRPQIPYFTQAILANKDLPINLKGIAFGDATFGNFAAMTDVVATTYMKQQSKILQISDNVFELFEAADLRCGFAGVEAQVTYPPQGPISIPGDPEGENFRLKKRQTSNTDGCITNPNVPALVNQSINLCNGGCATFTTGLDYLNSTRPWYDIPPSHQTQPDPVSQLQPLQHRL